MNKARRLEIEEALLRKTFGPTFRIQEGSSSARGVVGKVHTNSGAEYVLFIPIKRFPDQAPAAYVVARKLLGANGKPLPELSRDMHTRERDEHGSVQVCHYADASWSSEVTLYKVVMKVRIWLEAYEAHLRTGKPIDKYLGHM